MTAGDERKQQILAAATELFIRQGYGGTRTRDIAVRADVSEAVLFKYFPSKRALGMAVVEARLDALSPRHLDWERLSAKSPRRLIRNLACLAVRRLSQDRLLNRLRSFILMDDQPETARRLCRLMREWELRLRICIDKARGRGQVRERLDVDILGLVLLGIIYHQDGKWDCLGNVGHTRFRSIDLVDQLVTLIFEGVVDNERWS